MTTNNMAEVQTIEVESELTELTDSELQQINGAGIWTFVKQTAQATGDFLVDILD